MTAGGLVLIGATNDRKFRAFDSATGAEIWMVRLPASWMATPITYMAKKTASSSWASLPGAGTNTLYSQES